MVEPDYDVVGDDASENMSEVEKTQATMARVWTLVEDKRRKKPRVSTED